MEVVAEAVAGTADVADHVALLDRPGSDREARLMGVAGREPAAVIDAGVVAVAAALGLALGEGDRAVFGGTDRRPGRHGDVDALVGAAPAHPEAGDDRPVDGPDEAGGPALDRPGRQRRDAARRGELLLDLLLDVADVALEMVDVALDPRQRLPAAAAGAVELGLAVLELLPGPLELRLLGGDRVTRGPDAVDGLTGVVPELADAADDLGVAVLDPLQVLVAAEGIVEAIRLEDDRDRGRVVGLVDVDEPVLERLHGPVEALAEDPQVVLLGGELGLGLVELLLDRRLARPQRRDLAG